MKTMASHLIDCWLMLPLIVKVITPAILILALGLAYFFLKQLVTSPPKERHIRGVLQVSARKLAALTRHVLSNGSSPQLPVGPVFVPRYLEDRHTAIIGSTGTGKSTLLRTFLPVIRARGARCVVVDLGGEFYSEFAQRGDLRFHPDALGSVRWNPLGEVKSEHDIPLVLASILPGGNTPDEEVWRSKAREFLQVIMSGLWKHNILDMASLKRYVIDAGEKELQKFFSDHGSRLESNSMTSTVRALAIDAVNGLRFAALDPDFSVRSWAQTGKGFLFITPDNRDRAALSGMINALLNMLIAETLSAPPGARYTPIFLIVDELSSFDIGDLQGVLEKGRKYGLTAICGMQTVAQLRQKFGPNGAAVLMSCFRTKVIFNPGEAETARAMAEEIGRQTIERKVTSHSRNSQGGGVNTSDGLVREERFAVSPDELLMLPDLMCYIKFVADLPVAKVRIRRD